MLDIDIVITALEFLDMYCINESMNVKPSTNEFICEKVHDNDLESKECLNVSELDSFNGIESTASLECKDKQSFQHDFTERIELCLIAIMDVISNRSHGTCATNENSEQARITELEMQCFSSRTLTRILKNNNVLKARHFVQIWSKLVDLVRYLFILWQDEKSCVLNTGICSLLYCLQDLVIISPTVFVVDDSENEAENDCVFPLNLVTEMLSVDSIILQTAVVDLLSSLFSIDQIKLISPPKISVLIDALRKLLNQCESNIGTMRRTSANANYFQLVQTLKQILWRIAAFLPDSTEFSSWNSWYSVLQCEKSSSIKLLGISGFYSKPISAERSIKFKAALEEFSRVGNMEEKATKIEKEADKSVVQKSTFSDVAENFGFEANRSLPQIAVPPSSTPLIDSTSSKSSLSQTQTNQANQMELPKDLFSDLFLNFSKPVQSPGTSSACRAQTTNDTSSTLIASEMQLSCIQCTFEIQVPYGCGQDAIPCPMCDHPISIPTHIADPNILSPSHPTSHDLPKARTDSQIDQSTRCSVCATPLQSIPGNFKLQCPLCGEIRRV